MVNVREYDHFFDLGIAAVGPPGSVMRTGCVGVGGPWEEGKGGGGEAGGTHEADREGGGEHQLLA